MYHCRALLKIKWVQIFFHHDTLVWYYEHILKPSQVCCGFFIVVV